MPRQPIPVPVENKSGRPIDQETSTTNLLEGSALARRGHSHIATQFGNRGTITTIAELWAGTAETVPRSDSSGALTVISSSANDTNTGPGSGANLVVVEYIDADGYERMGLATMNGTGAVTVYEATEGSSTYTWPPTIAAASSPVAATGIRINRMYVTKANGVLTWGEDNAGTISGRIGGTQVCAIAAADNVSRMSSYHVPKGKVGLLRKIQVQIADPGDVAADRPSATVTLIVRPWQRPAMVLGTFAAERGDIEFSSPLRIEGRSDVVVRVSAVSAVTASSVLQLDLHDDDLVADSSPTEQPSRVV